MTKRSAAMNTLDLISLKNLLDEIQIESQLLEASTVMPLSTLMAAIDQDHQGRDRAFSFSFIPLPDETFADVKLLQCYTELPFAVAETFKGDVETLLLAINLTLPLGNFGLQNEQLVYFRYSCTLPKYTVLSDSQALLIDVIKLVVYALEGNADLIEQVATQQKTLKQALSELRS